MWEWFFKKSKIKAPLSSCLNEQEIIPYHTSHPIGERALILAPHPDDETLGCGGAILKLVESQKQVKIIFLTSGDKADPSDPRCSITHGKSHISDYSIMREDEAKSALNILGITDYMFLRFPDRELHKNYTDVLSSLGNIVSDFKPDAVYSPSPIELNPDHRTTAAAALLLQEKNRGIKVVYYEVTVPLRPNLLVDITAQNAIKITSINDYKSQIKLMDYAGYIGALNRMRALTAGKDAKYCEAFWVLDAPYTDVGVCNYLSYREVLR